MFTLKNVIQNCQVAQILALSFFNIKLHSQFDAPKNDEVWETAQNEQNKCFSKQAFLDILRAPKKYATLVSSYFKYVNISMHMRSF